MGYSCDADRPSCRNLRFVVFLDDHGPPGGRPSLVWARGFDRANLSRAMLETLAERAKLLAAWRRVHGSQEGST